MAKEIERKFLVCDDSYRAEATGSVEMSQAYLSTAIDTTVRVRIAGERGFLTVKGKNDGTVRDEWEYEIPATDARQMIERCTLSPVIRKTRYRAGRWEIDEFHGCLEGLTVAEIELSDPDEPVELPKFIGQEVTGDPRYYNSTLAKTGKIPV